MKNNVIGFFHAVLNILSNLPEQLQTQTQIIKEEESSDMGHVQLKVSSDHM